MNTEIKTPTGEVIGTVSDETGLVDIERAEPHFFKTKFGKRETFTIHRGQLICRYTARLSHGPVRMTSVYLFIHRPGHAKPDTLNISSRNPVASVRQAERLIDSIIDSGTYDRGY
jgi:hypothetical protein